MASPDDEPVVVAHHRQPTSVIISLKDYEERFVDRVAAAGRKELAEEILAFRKRAKR
jgi:PHD/YefM family antitoxin component YafN of YafNO toxin-antitoxin module